MSRKRKSRHHRANSFGGPRQPRRGFTHFDAGAIERCDASIAPQPPNSVADRNSPAEPSSPPRTALKLDAAMKARICDLVALGDTIKSAAEAVGISEGAVHYAKRRDLEFRKELLKNRADPAHVCLRTMKRAAGENWRAAFHYMKIIKPERFDRRANMIPLKQAQQLVDATLDVARAIMTDEQIRELDQRLAKFAGQPAGRRAG